MPADPFKDQIKELIAKDQADKALAQLLTFVKQNEGFKEVERSALINNGQLERLEKERRDNNLSPEQYAAEKNRILVALLSLIDELEPEKINGALNFVTEAPPNPISSSLSTYSFHDQIFISVILLLLVSSVIAFFYFTFNENYGQGGVFFSSASATCLVYINWRKKATVITTQL